MTKTKHYEISVIVPVYNAEKTIERCVMSLLFQDEAVEIILVDDGSFDGSRLMCDKYALEHENVIALHQSNKGVSSARNYGLRHASGAYIGFVDSDDYVMPSMFRCLKQKIKQDNVDIAIIRMDNTMKKSSEYKTHRDIIKDIVCSSAVRGYPWNKLFKRSIIEKSNLHFKEDIHVMEDKLFCLQYMDSCVGGY